VVTTLISGKTPVANRKVARQVATENGKFKKTVNQTAEQVRG